jgi:hypothetical protein
MLLAIAEATLLAALVVGLVAGTAFAAKGSHSGGGSTSGGSTINLVLMNGATAPTYGGQVTFAISTTATQYPWVHLRCYVGGALVLEGYQGFFPTALGNQWFNLGPTPSWSGGPANCVATLEKYSSKGAWQVLASTSFDVAG